MPPSADHRIRTELNFVAKTDIRMVRAFIQLLKAAGVKHPPGVHDLLKHHAFRVDGHRYSGLMTQEQSDYLAASIMAGTTLDQFADTIGDVIMCLNKGLFDSMTSIENSLCACKKTVQSQENGPVAMQTFGSIPSAGCCTYDSKGPTNGVLQSVCDGLLGTWHAGPCIQVTKP